MSGAQVNPRQILLSVHLQGYQPSCLAKGGRSRGDLIQEKGGEGEGNLELLINEKGRKSTIRRQNTTSGVGERVLRKYLQLLEQRGEEDYLKEHVKVQNVPGNVKTAKI